jgi:hypothetical protein
LLFHQSFDHYPQAPGEAATGRPASRSAEEICKKLAIGMTAGKARNQPKVDDPLMK